MNHVQAWQAIFRLSCGNQWVEIPREIKTTLQLDNRLGICGGIICTKISAEYANEFIKRLNRIGAK